MGPKSGNLVLDSDKGELVKANGKIEKKNAIVEGKSKEALKNHSEAERRRRERINSHLDTLRGLVPCNQKMDKAALLAEVIDQVKKLKNIASDATKGLQIPMDADEVRVEPLDEHCSTFMASLCCDYRSDLMSDVKLAFSSVDVNVVKAEISTLGGRVKNVIVFTVDINCGNVVEVVNSIRDALSSIVDKMSVSLDYTPRTYLPNKRPRISLLDHPSS
jgi:UTP:GlnB (protein PII) uridylyltransferase